MSIVGALQDMKSQSSNKQSGISLAARHVLISTERTMLSLVGADGGMEVLPESAVAEAGVAKCG